jgi:hypothetical protein
VEPREPFGGAPERGASPTRPTVGNQFRPRYADRDYAGHGYWDDQQNGQNGVARVGTDHTGSWRLSELSSPDHNPASPALRDVFDDDRDYPAVMWWTGIWYGAPIVLYLLLALFLSTSAMRGHAFGALGDDALPVALAIAVSVGIAAGVRRITLAWRAITVGFGAAVVGAGLVTLLISAF